ncbi:Glucagon-like peptide 2 receptor [Myotis davidii]|uniref:Glucagon-like peptide 2 receptor n=1 Tax=Myotis davidii TaxID=225400 RepID=L5LZI3_MYODS|nr:Glucagon-like peptide 2 receptor [Myotis davidii]
MPAASSGLRSAAAQVEHHALLSTLQLLYTVGYSLSTVALLLALTLLLFLRKLHCTRNYIHMNLFASFVLKALAVLGKDIVFHNSYSRRPDTEREWVSYMSEISTSCRSAQVLLHYVVGANYSWLLVEGLYLRTLLEPTVLSERRLWPTYLLGLLVALQYCFVNGEVKAELRRHWGRFMLAHHSGCRAWGLEKNFRFLGKYPKKLSKGDSARALQKSQSSPGGGQLLPLTMQGLGEPGTRSHGGHTAWRWGRSLSESSEGDFTQAHTMEEILEESEM